MADPRLLRISDILDTTSLSQATIYRYIKHGDFPKQVRLGPGRVGWREIDVLNWISRLDDPDGKKADEFTRVARRLAEGTLKGQIILGQPRRVRILRTDEKVVIERKEGAE